MHTKMVAFCQQPATPPLTVQLTLHAMQLPAKWLSNAVYVYGMLESAAL
jgi:hypothetical protein